MLSFLVRCLELQWKHDKLIVLRSSGFRIISCLAKISDMQHDSARTKTRHGLGPGHSAVRTVIELFSVSKYSDSKA